MVPSVQKEGQKTIVLLNIVDETLINTCNTRDVNKIFDRY